MYGLRIFFGPPIYLLPGNVISATVGFAYINLHPEYELPSSTRFGQFLMFGKTGVGGTVLPSHPQGNNFFTRSPLFHGYLCVRFDPPSSINFRDLKAFPNWGPSSNICSTVELS